MKIKLNGFYYLNFTDFSYDQSLDSVASSFSLACRFDSENRSLFKPLSFPKVEFFNDEEKLFFTGIIIDYNFNSNSETNLIQLSGYSTPGVLEDCNIPYSSYPLESNNMNLKEIIEKFIKPFKIKLIVDPSAKNEALKNYAKTSAAPEDSLKDYFSKLAAQRNLILSHKENGDLFLFKADPKATPIFLFNKENTKEMSLSISGQNMHSEITLLRQPKPKKTEKKKEPKPDAEEYEDELGYTHKKDPSTPPKPKSKKIKEKPQYFDTVKNPLVEIFRPTVKMLTEGEDFDTKNAAKNQLADELKNIKVSIKIEGWEDIFPGQIIEVQNEEIYFEERVKLIIENIKKSGSSGSKEMDINCIPVEAYTGETPKNIFK